MIPTTTSSRSSKANASTIITNILILTLTHSSILPSSVSASQVPGNGVAFLQGQWYSGIGTHYGPFPSRAYMSEPGYMANDVGVGCSNGQPGGDPRWNQILSHGLYPPPPTFNQTIWPKTPTVAVSQRMYGNNNKAQICFNTLKIRNKNRPELSLVAYVVDFCPRDGCQWDQQGLSFNVDLYGEATWEALGAGLDDGSVELEIQWPAGLTPLDIGAGMSNFRISIAFTVVLSILTSLLSYSSL
ncbi:hypothetical protein HDU76_004440, partial [Blyttiomyces sp. JEL0837]